MATHQNAVHSIFPTLSKDVTNDVTLTSQEAMDVGILVISDAGTSKSVIFPKAIEGKVIVVYNSDATNAVTIKVAGQTGVSVAATKSAILRCTNTDFARVTADA